jgi:cell division protein FtsB
MSDDELTSLRAEVRQLRRRVQELEAEIAALKNDVEILAFENAALDKQRRQDAFRLASRGLD